MTVQQKGVPSTEAAEVRAQVQTLTRVDVGLDGYPDPGAGKMGGGGAKLSVKTKASIKYNCKKPHSFNSRSIEYRA